MGKHLKLFVAACAVGASLFAAPARAAQIDVTKFGDGGWYSDDTRSGATTYASGTNLVGVVSTNPLIAKPGSVASNADDVEIATQIQFVAGPAGATFGGAVLLNGTNSNNGKSNISVVSPTVGFGPSSALTSPSFGAEYRWYDQPNATSRTVAFKIGIQRDNWGTGAGQSQNGYTANRSGENIWDYVLVHVGASSNNAWSIESVDHDSGGWNLFRQAGPTVNPNDPAPPASVDSPTMTLDDWAADSTWGPILFASGAKISSIQLGIGSSQRDSIEYVDYLQTSLLNGGDPINFAVPEPASISLLALGGLALLKRRRSC